MNGKRPPEGRPHRGRHASGTVPSLRPADRSGDALRVALRSVLQPPCGAQLPSRRRSVRGAQWRFVRIKYHFTAEGTGLEQDFYGEPWMIDGPAAEQNLSRRLKTATSIHVEDPMSLTLDDPRLFTFPWIYIVEPGNLELLDSEVEDAARVPAERRDR